MSSNTRRRLVTLHSSHRALSHTHSQRFLIQDEYVKCGFLHPSPSCSLSFESYTYTHHTSKSRRFFRDLNTNMDNFVFNVPIAAHNPYEQNLSDYDEYFLRDLDAIFGSCHQENGEYQEHSTPLSSVIPQQRTLQTEHQVRHFEKSVKTAHVLCVVYVQPSGAYCV